MVYVHFDARVHAALNAGVSHAGGIDTHDWSRSRAALAELLAEYGETIPDTPTTDVFGETQVIRDPSHPGEEPRT